MDNPDISGYLAVEPMLHLELVKVHGQYWAGSAGTHHWQVSPLYGDMAGLPPVTMTCGTRELLYPDILLARDKLAEAGVDVTLRVGRGLNHDWPLMPIPEAEAAFREIVGEF
jgi:acetyl esterase/lipase